MLLSLQKYNIAEIELARGGTAPEGSHGGKLLSLILLQSSPCFFSKRQCTMIGKKSPGGDRVLGAQGPQCFSSSLRAARGPSLAKPTLTQGTGDPGNRGQGLANVFCGEPD